jgi:quercetin dioxygenase-like cupin family protein
MTSSIKIVPKGWGYEKWIVNNTKYCGKLLFFERNKRCSWHYHKIKEETFYLQSGKIYLWYGWDDDLAKADMKIMEPGDSFHVPIGLKHQMIALEDSDLFEFSTEHFEKDSYRIIKGD